MPTRAPARARLTALLLLVAPVACGRPDPLIDVEELPAWRLSSAPVAVIGGHDERATHSLSGVRGALLLGDGRLAIGDRQTRQIRYFSSAGDHLETLGGSGSGPGEFRMLGTIHHGPDGGVCAWDVAPRIVTCFPAEPGPPSIIEVELDQLWDVVPSLLGFFEDGSFVLYQDQDPPFGMRELPSGERRDTVEYTLFRSNGRLSRTLARLPGNETYFRNEEGMWGSSEIFFGRRIIGTVDGVLAIGMSDSIDVRLLDAAGSEVSRFATTWGLQPVTEREVDSLRAIELREVEAAEASRGFTMDPPAMASFARQQRLAITERPYRPTKAAFDRLHVSHDTLLWLAEPLAVNSAVRRWIVIDPRDGPVARLDIPADAELLDVAADRMLLVTKDELGIESVLLMSIERS